MDKFLVFFCYCCTSGILFVPYKALFYGWVHDDIVVFLLFSTPFQVFANPFHYGCLNNWIILLGLVNERSVQVTVFNAPRQ